ncbi:uncharacterized protein BJ212DRAFT_1367515 [Suillus subaureus]|uniref:Uncharacterized protein n=1 Tax=Suillus subaureus TaxID=48587 RepID=A0A9P7E780_9AGAM|nr:uncharacterized protein BJ212DRAFT_1367515 [Suillus subaureus]KAG1813253.1 hypothetical protein BJ212DRAFT_1367515 [Suillus subaureus]
MRLVLVITLALSQAFVVLSQHAEPAFQVPTYSSTCEEQARQSGLPTDGWKIVYEDGGQPKCRRMTVQELDICHGVEYIDADTKDKRCCQDVSGLTWIDRPAKLAKCCAKDHVWTFDNGDGPTRGGCCMVGLHMHNGNCVPPYTPRPPLHCPPGTYSIDDRCVPIIASPPRCPVGTFLQDGMCIPVPVQIVSCPVGTYSNDGQCVPTIASPPRCPVGTFMRDGMCVGTYLNDGRCIPIIASPPRCPPGTFMHDGMCLQIPNDICPIGTRMQDGQCVPLLQACSNGRDSVEPSVAYANHPVCGHDKYPGIRHGQWSCSQTQHELNSLENDQIRFNSKLN